MKKLFIFLCVAMMFFLIAGCPSDDPASKLIQSSHSSKSVSYSDSVSKTETNNVSPAPEPATLILLGSGLVGLAVFGRKIFKK